jgi:hypothetical protein
MAGRITWVHTLYTALLGLWLGTFVTVGAMAVPTLFNALPAHAAADIAVTLFRQQGLVSFIVMAMLLVTRVLSDLRAISLENKLLSAVLLCGALLQFWVMPELLAQRPLAAKEPAWHVASSALYLLQACCVLVVFIQRIRTPTLTVPKAAKRVKPLPPLETELTEWATQPLV